MPKSKKLSHSDAGNITIANDDIFFSTGDRLKDAKQEKKRLEKNICKKLDNFKNRFGVKVEAVEISTNRIDGSDDIIEVTIDTRL